VIVDCDRVVEETHAADERALPIVAVVPDHKGPGQPTTDQKTEIDWLLIVWLERLLLRASYVPLSFSERKSKNARRASDIQKSENSTLCGSSELLWVKQPSQTCIKNQSPSAVSVIPARPRGSNVT
jgi:hypothetical protein